ncbi:hypothetical protein AAVH_09522 [Aphelenchoides avenae]|nr:hypothetical protein AAVH_09522 [Aphelenchus avenae]
MPHDTLGPNKLDDGLHQQNAEDAEPNSNSQLDDILKSCAQAARMANQATFVAYAAYSQAPVQHIILPTGADYTGTSVLRIIDSAHWAAHAERAVAEAVEGYATAAKNAARAVEKATSMGEMALQCATKKLDAANEAVATAKAAQEALEKWSK